MNEIISSSRMETASRITTTLRSPVHDLPRIWIDLPDGGIPDDEALGDVAAAVGLLPGMMTGLPVRTDPACSPAYGRSLERYSEILRAWWPDEVRATKMTALRSTDSPRARGVAAFFTGGVDSFHTLLRHRERLDAIVYVRGFDLPVEHVDALDEVSARNREIAERVGVRYLEFETNLGDLLKPHLDWGRITHGIGLGCIAQLLPLYGIGTVHVPSSRPYQSLKPLGSHPLLDPLWSTGRIDVDHDGASADRAEKIAAIGDDELTREYVRVCWESGLGGNCSQCEKCIRTMVLFHAYGQLERVRTFAPSRPLTELADRRLRGDTELVYAQMIVDVLGRTGADPELAKVFQRRIRRYPERAPVPLRTVLRRIPGARRAVGLARATRARLQS